MALTPLRNKQLNYFKLAFIVLDKFPKALRQTFRTRWDNTFAHLPGYQPWDDSAAVRNLFLTTEGGKTKVPTHISYDEWDCSALFQATIYARSFALPDSRGHHRTLADLYVKPRRLSGSFHASVISPGGDNAETFALAIDQLRLLRNFLCHSPSSEMNKIKFDQYVQLAKDAFKALGVNTNPIDAVGGLTESDFPTKRVRQLEEDIRRELLSANKFLQEEVKELLGIRSELAQSNQERREDQKRTETEIKDEIQDLKKQLQFDKDELKEKLMSIRSDITQSTQERQSDLIGTEAERMREFEELTSQLQVGEDALKEEIRKTAETFMEANREVTKKLDNISKSKESGK